jgi:hypothetical protein
MKKSYPPEAVKQIEELQLQNKLMRQLATTNGFFQYYFSQLKYHRTNIECFNAVNDLYLDFFGEERYSSYKSFQVLQSRYYTHKK